MRNDLIYVDIRLPGLGRAFMRVDVVSVRASAAKMPWRNLRGL